MTAGGLEAENALKPSSLRIVPFKPRDFDHLRFGDQALAHRVTPRQT